MSELSLEYERVERQLASADVESSGAELHGIVCGLLCAGGSDGLSLLKNELVSDLSPDDLLVQECWESAQRLYTETQTAINGPGLGFTPFLPDDEKPIRTRAMAVSEWCQGFLYGLGLGGLEDEKQLSEEAREALSDLTEITRMDVEALADDEENEDALVELTEFIWVAAMLVREEITHLSAERS